MLKGRYGTLSEQLRRKSLAVPHAKFIPMRHFTNAEKRRFWELVDGSSDICWTWRATKTSGGYGFFRKYSAHRIAYFLASGIDPGNAQVCHSCDNPCCCNPAHLFVGSHNDNMADKMAKGRARGRYSKSPRNRTNADAKKACL